MGKAKADKVPRQQCSGDTDTSDSEGAEQEVYDHSGWQSMMKRDPYPNGFATEEDPNIYKNICDVERKQQFENLAAAVHSAVNAAAKTPGNLGTPGSIHFNFGFIRLEKSIILFLRRDRI